MIWPFNRKPKPPGLTEAERARTEALVNLARAQAREPEVSRISLSLREWREQNHIVEQLDRLFYRGGTSA